MSVRVCVQKKKELVLIYLEIERKNGKKRKIAEQEPLLRACYGLAIFFSLSRRRRMIRLAVCECARRVMAKVSTVVLAVRRRI